MASASTATHSKKPQREMELLQGDITAMRPVKVEDLPVLQAWDEDPEIIALMGKKYDHTTTEDWFRSLGERRTCRAWVIETLEGRLIGELELAQINWRAGTAELRICIGERDCWSKGYGTDAIRALLRLCFTTYELQTVYLRVFAANARAVKVYQRLGFRTEAVLQPSSRREDLSAVLLMSMSRVRWQHRQAG